MTQSPEAPSTAGLEQFGYRQELSRSLSFTDLLIYGLIFMVPIAPMAIFGRCSPRSGGMVVLAYAIGMVAHGVHRVVVLADGRAFPMSGSVYNYVGRGIAPPVGFLAGWAILLDYVLVPGLLYLVACVADALARCSAVPVWVWLVGVRRAEHGRQLPRYQDDRPVHLDHAGRRADRAGDLPRLGVVGARHRQGPVDVGARCTTRTRSPGRWCSPRSPSPCCRFLGFDGISMLAEESQGRRAGDRPGDGRRAAAWRVCCSSRRPGWRPC